jgi:hypothetical protein
MMTWRLHRLKADLTALKPAEGLGLERFLDVAARLDWGPIPKDKWQKVLAV